jgi:hypothetical protein
VTVRDRAALDLRTGMTVEAWVYPERRGRRAIAVKESARGVAWGLYAPKLPLRRWAHVALTFDGAAERTYVNGRLVATRPRSAPLAVTSYPLRFGGHARRQWFAGRLDEVRVYDRALTAEQIQADMARAVTRTPRR